MKGLPRLFAAIALSNVVAAGCGFLSLLLLARFCDVPTFGRAGFVLAVVTFLATVADCGYSSAVVVHGARAGADRDGVAIAVRSFAGYLPKLVLCSLPVAYLLWQGYRMTVAELAVVMLGVWCSLLGRFGISLHHAAGEWRPFGVLTVAGNLVRLVALLLFVGAAARRGEGAEGLYSAFLTGTALAFVLQLVISGWMSRSLLLRAVRYRAQEQELRQFHALLLPLAGATLCAVVTMRFDVLLIEYRLGAEWLGIYTAANSLAMIFPLVTGSLIQLFLREAALGPSDFLQRFFPLQHRLLPVLVVALTAAVLLSGPVITSLFGERYQAARPVLQILLVPYLGGVFFTPLESYFYAAEPEVIKRLKLLQMGIVVAVSILLIGYWGISGVAAAIALSRVVGWGMVYGLSRRAFRQGIHSTT